MTIFSCMPTSVGSKTVSNMMTYPRVLRFFFHKESQSSYYFSFINDHSSAVQQMGLYQGDRDNNKNAKSSWFQCGIWQYRVGAIRTQLLVQVKRLNTRRVNQHSFVVKSSVIDTDGQNHLCFVPTHAYTYTHTYTHIRTHTRRGSSLDES